MSDLPDGTLLAVGALVLLLAGLGTAAVALTGVEWLRLPALGLCALAAPSWVAVSDPLEGVVLVAFTRDHGLTLSDLIAVVAVLLAGLLVRDLRDAQR